VEHPVTECTTGLDLVALQLEMAAGGALTPDPPIAQGHSIEARLYAEDPATDWRPQSGSLHRFELDRLAACFTVSSSPSGIRCDSGVGGTAEVSVHYDPMLAKIISWAPTRAHAARLLADALARARIHGLVTNRDLLVNVLRHKAFLAGDTDTAFFERHDLNGLAAPLADPDATRLAALAAALALDAAAREQAGVLRTIPSGWRNVVSQSQRIAFAEAAVAYRLTRAGLVADEHPDVALLDARPDEVSLIHAGVRHRFAVARYGEEVFVDSPLGPVRLHLEPRFAEPTEPTPPGSLLAPMPGTVARLGAAVGDTVAAGATIIWLEAMKMQHRIDAPSTGVLTELPVQQGQSVDVGTVLAVITEPIEPTPPTEETS
jgi:propionyl-CoA carboxylase alpha chain